MKKFGKIFLAVFAVLGLCGGVFFGVRGLSAKAESVEIASFEQLRDELALVEERNIILTSDIVLTDTLTIEKSLSITASGDVTITRGSNFTDKMFHIAEGVNVSFDAEVGNSIVFDGESVQVDSTAIENDGILTLGDNVGMKGFISTISGVALRNYGTLNISGAEIFNNEHIQNSEVADTYGIIISNSHSTVTFNSGKIHNNVTDTSGVIFLNDNSTFEMNGGEIYENQASGGAGIFVKNATVSLNGGKLYDNTASGNGGAVYAKNSGTTTLGAVEIYGNTAAGNGGALYVTDDAKVVINNANIHENVVGSGSNYGGGMYVTSASSVTMNGGQIWGHTVESSGAGVFAASTSTFTLNGGKIKDNTATNNGGAVVVKSNFVMNGGEISGNSAKVGGGVYIYNTASVPARATINGGQIINNSSTNQGGGVAIKDGVLTVNDGTFEGNSAKNGGAIAVFDSANVEITDGEFGSNTVTERGPDIYAYATETSKYSTLTVTGGEFEEIATQYAMLYVGGDLSVSNHIRFWAGTKANYAKVGIVKDLENDVVFKLNSVYDEGTNQRFNYVSTDVYSNIYRSANKITLDYSTAQYLKVENNKMYVTAIGSKKKIDVMADEYVVDAPKYAEVGETVSFGTQREFSISNVTVTGADESVIAVTANDGTYSFEMPDQNVKIDYDVIYNPLALTVDESIEDVVDVEEAYTFKQNVQISEVILTTKKLAKLYVDYGNGNSKELTINEQGKANFKMFYGARIYGETKNYYDVSYQANEMIVTVDFENTHVLEGDEVSFTITEDRAGEKMRYLLASAYYMDGENKVVISEENDVFTFVMPSFDAEIIFEYKDALQDIEGETIMVESFAQLQNALNIDGGVVVLLNDIEVAETLTMTEGVHTIVALNNCSLVRANNFNGNMLELGFGSVLNLNIDSDALSYLTIDGNNVQTTASAIYVEENGIVNIFDKVKIINNNVTALSSNYTVKGHGNTSAGGAAIFNFNGVVNMYGGEISNNRVATSGGAIYNYGNFNFFGGKIANNRATVSGGAVYNIRVFNQDGGVFDGNESGEYGGAVYNASSFYAYYYLKNGEVKNNRSTKSGGAIFNSSDGVVWIKGGELVANTTTSNGGAIFNKGTAFVVGGNFVENSATDKGGAIAAKDGITFIKGGTFTNNTAVARGGAVYVYGEIGECLAVVNITGGLFEGNTCPVGNAICVQYGVIEIGGEAEINGTIEMVANVKETYAYIKIVDELQNVVTLKLKTLENAIRLADGLDASEIVEKLHVDGCSVDVVDGRIVVSVNEG